MIDPPGLTDDWVGKAVAAVAAFISAWLLARVQTKATLITAAQSAAHQVIGDLRDELARLRDEHTVCNDRLSEIQRQIDALMRGRIANYEDKP